MQTKVVSPVNFSHKFINYPDFALISITNKIWLHTLMCYCNFSYFKSFDKNYAHNYAFFVQAYLYLKQELFRFRALLEILRVVDRQSIKNVNLNKVFEECLSANLVKIVAQVLSTKSDIKNNSKLSLTWFIYTTYLCILFDFKIQTQRGPVDLVRVRNPWGNSAEWNGPWGDRWIGFTIHCQV